MRVQLFAFLITLLGSWELAAQSLILKQGDRLAIIGDSITEQKLYSKFIETYLLACSPDLQVQCFQFGWGGEQAPGFAARMENDLVPWKPNIVTTCFGMNDGAYRAYEEKIGQRYDEGMRRIVERMKQAGARVVVGSPGVVDSHTWAMNRPEFDQVYNDNLQQLGEIAKRIATENQFVHADVFNAMKSTMIAAKASLGETYPVAGGDGVHPEANGHLVMAYAFLKALGLDGEIGNITIDIASGNAVASRGHNILNGKDGTFEVESTRYPFCFFGNEQDPNGTVSILPYVPFNQDLNRLLLKVNNLATAQADVTFGKSTKSFTKTQLESGINLAAEFLDNPFVEPFQKVMDQVAQKQAYETSMIKGLVTNFRQFREPLASDPEVVSAVNTLRRKMTEYDDILFQKAKATAVPVRFQITVKPKS